MKTQEAYEFLSLRYSKVKKETKKIVGFRTSIGREIALVLTNEFPSLFISIDPSIGNTFKFRLLKKYEKNDGRHSNLGANAPTLAIGNLAFSIEINTLDDLKKFCDWYASDIKKNKDTIFEKHIYFPIIAEIIDSELAIKESIHRDEIVQIILQKYHKKINQISLGVNKTSLFIAQNMVDWFSAELTKKSEIAAPWLGIYSTSKIKIRGREITNYSWANHPQDEVIPDNTLFKEGTLKQIQVNAYERNPQARQKCLDKFGYSCQCCTFNFEKTYGELGKKFIHVHHITPLSLIKNEYVLNPENDLIPVCANCHAMIHRKVPPYTIEEIRVLLNLS